MWKWLWERAENWLNQTSPLESRVLAKQAACSSFHSKHFQVHSENFQLAFPINNNWSIGLQLIPKFKMIINLQKRVEESRRTLLGWNVSMPNSLQNFRRRSSEFKLSNRLHPAQFCWMSSDSPETEPTTKVVNRLASPNVHSIRRSESDYPTD